jgi:hypothetical protein
VRIVTSVFFCSLVLMWFGAYYVWSSDCNHRQLPESQVFIGRIS